MLRKLLRKLTGKRKAIDVFMDRAWTIKESPIDDDDMVDFDGETGVITVNSNLPDAMRRDVMAVLTAKPATSDKHNVNTGEVSRIQRLLVKTTPR